MICELWSRAIQIKSDLMWFYYYLWLPATHYVLPNIFFSINVVSLVVFIHCARTTQDKEANETSVWQTEWHGNAGCSLERNTNNLLHFVIFFISNVYYITANVTLWTPLKRSCCSIFYFILFYFFRNIFSIFMMYSLFTILVRICAEFWHINYIVDYILANLIIF